jgi:hypothetical protein
MSWRKGRKTGEKYCVARHHRSMSPREADSVERYWERVERARGRKAIAEGLSEYYEDEREAKRSS